MKAIVLKKHNYTQNKTWQFSKKHVYISLWIFLIIYITLIKVHYVPNEFKNWTTSFINVYIFSNISIGLGNGQSMYIHFIPLLMFSGLWYLEFCVDYQGKFFWLVLQEVVFITICWFNIHTNRSNHLQYC